jgi:hypothetical protein
MAKKRFEERNISLRKFPFNYFKIATRLAHGTALEKLGKSCEYVIALDGDTKNSTYSIKFRVSYQESFMKCQVNISFCFYIGCISTTIC